ncbi:MAG: hypothetical protein VKJ24_10740 [Synechococcales bacterium]|nr:hypothetical protein [Synechococcales bacterium]
MLKFASNKIGTVALGLVLVSALVAPGSARADQRNFSMVNDSEKVISELYVSRIGTSNWEEDILGVDVLAPGSSTNVNFASDVAGRCQYDVQVIAGGEASILPNVDLCETLEIIYTNEGLVSR